MITGVASAYENNVPMLAITEQTAISTFGKGAIQDSSYTGINTIGLYQHCSRYNTLISHPAQFEHKLSAAIMSAMGSPAGPARNIERLGLQQFSGLSSGQATTSRGV
jgi:acetolactate synthase-1/2/3 large subunit